MYFQPTVYKIILRIIHWIDIAVDFDYAKGKGMQARMNKGSRNE